MKEREELFEKKLGLFFHDSPDKPFVLLSGKGHARRAREISEKLGLTYIRGSASDIIASSMERYYLPKGANLNKDLQVRFKDSPEFIHSLSGKSYDGFTNIEDHVFIEAVDAAIDEISRIDFNESIPFSLYGFFS